MLERLHGRAKFERLQGSSYGSGQKKRDADSVRVCVCCAFVSFLFFSFKGALRTFGAGHSKVRASGPWSTTLADSSQSSIHWTRDERLYHHTPSPLSDLSLSLLTSLLFSTNQPLPPPLYLPTKKKTLPSSIRTSENDGGGDTRRALELGGYEPTTASSLSLQTTKFRD